jgi:hypothetical protein
MTWAVTWEANCVCIKYQSVLQATDGFGGLVVSLITHNDVPQSVGLLWTSDQSVAETST